MRLALCKAGLSWADTLALDIIDVQHILALSHDKPRSTSTGQASHETTYVSRRQKKTP